MQRKFRLVVFLIILFGVTGCEVIKKAPTPVPFTLVDEQSISDIQLAGPASEAGAEFSSMAWCGDQLILLPQFPGQYAVDGVDYVFAIDREDIDTYLSTETPNTIMPVMVAFDKAGLDKSSLGFEGYEAVVFDGDRFFVTIEASPAGGMKGYLVQGSVVDACQGFVLDADSVLPVDPQANLSNMTDESAVIYKDRLYTLYEANGANVNPNPAAHQLDLLSMTFGKLPMTNIEYRVTDATTADENGVFWVINYFYPGDTKLNPALDTIAQTYGLGNSHADYDQVERLVALQVSEDGVALVNTPPIYLKLPDNEARNWEGIVRYADGFLLVTDKFPDSMLAFVPSP